MAQQVPFPRRRVLSQGSHARRRNPVFHVFPAELWVRVLCQLYRSGSGYGSRTVAGEPRPPRGEKGVGIFIYLYSCNWTVSTQTSHSWTGESHQFSLIEAFPSFCHISRTPSSPSIPHPTFLAPWFRLIIIFHKPGLTDSTFCV